VLKEDCMTTPLVLPKRERRSLRRQRGFSLIELLIVIAIILVIVTIAVPNYQKYQMAARETSVINELGTIYGAEVNYYSTFGKYAANLSELGPPTGGAEGPQGAGLISKTLAEGSHSGYKYTLTGNGTSFAVSAVPDVFGSSGRRTFFMDQTKVIRQNWTAEPATTNSPELK
jgi:prepilin-type N-terminal cleavage/methylation domain-containing protein